MRHQIKVRKLSRPKSHREALLANLATSLFDNRTIQTTEPKAKELKKVVDRLITVAKKDTLAARRQVARTIRDKKVLKKLFNDIVPQFKERESGFTRVMRVGFRRGDAAMISMVELLTEKPKVDKDKEKAKKEKKEKKARRK
ncbi:MAG TPA: 50S ribosomal protein L17 [candidate division Zixibacteria bacterium]|nr:50S ribosomal protein L17 [candidate division Zixibacteria bacterium]